MKLKVVLLVLFASTAAYAQQLKFKTGEIFTIISHDNTQTVSGAYKFKVDNTYTFQFKALGGSGNEYKFQCVLQRAKSSVDVNQNMHLRLNTDSLKQQLTFDSWGFLNPVALLQRPFTVVVSTKSKLLRIEGYNELIKQTIANWHLTPARAEWLDKKSNDPILAMLNKAFFEFPDASLGYQSTWKKDTISYNVVAVRGALLDIKAIDDKKTVDAKYVVNDSNGLLEEALVTTKRKDFYNNYTQTPGQNNSVNVVDTAWLNMAALLSDVSDAFNTPGKRIDHEKAFAYFKAHDEQFKDDNYYLVRKLSMLKHLDDPMMAMRQYNAALMQTPNSLIKDQPFPLYDKLQMLETKDAAAAFDVLKYIYKTQWEDWIQLYARNFLEKKDPITYELIGMLNADKTMKLQPKLQALSAWVDAKDNADNALSLTKAYNAFMHLSDINTKNGDGNRYALMTYKLLQKAKPKEADKLLQTTIEKLERYTADTLNKRRYQDNDILTHAYYLKYQALNKTDSVKALAYLAKAAYALIIKRRKEIGELSDMVFLEYKSNYRDEYITKLFAHGDSEAALKLFVEHINTDISKLDDMEAIYQSRFKDKSFKEFFNTRVLPAWQNAPGFSLAGMNGQTHKLTDYKGKWLVMDFWGTWCTPCREEMPGINKYNDEINAGKHPGVSLLNIACMDNELNVRKYLKENKFGITNAMGNEAVPVQYKIKGYPAKRVVSPNGKVIDVPSLADWQMVVKKLNELYVAAN